MPLRVATKLAYREARANKTHWAAAAERLAAEKTPDGILNYVGTYFGMLVPIYGARPPSAQLEEISKNMASNGRLMRGASRLTHRDNANTEFIDLQVKAKDVRMVMKLMAEKVFADRST